MIDKVLCLIVGAPDDAVVARTEHVPGNAAEDSRLVARRGMAIRAQHVLRHCVVDAVVRGFPATTAVKTIVSAIVLSHARTLKRVPVVYRAVHRAPGLEALPVEAGAQHRAFTAGQPGHVE